MVALGPLNSMNNTNQILKTTISRPPITVWLFINRKKITSMVQHRLEAESAKLAEGRQPVKV